MFDNLGQQIYNTLIANDRWTMFLDGLLVTLMIAGIAVLMGVVIGSVVAIAKVNALRNKAPEMAERHLRYLPDGDSGHAGAGAASDYVLYYFCCCADRDGAICCGACIWY